MPQKMLLYELADLVRRMRFLQKTARSMRQYLECCVSDMQEEQILEYLRKVEEAEQQQRDYEARVDIWLASIRT